jgi:hypothetical protein
MRRIAFALAALVMTLPVTAAAQPPQLGEIRFDGDIGNNGTVGGASVGPYQADLRGFAPLIGDVDNAVIWCVDWSHFAPARNTWDSYNATAFSGADFSETRSGGPSEYRKAAWLIEQYDLGTSGFSATNVQGTIWRLFDGAAPTAQQGGYVNLLGAVPGNFVLTKDWFVLSDDEMTCGRHVPNCDSNQEFLAWRDRPNSSLVLTPEPTTYALMLAGLVGIGVAVRRRRRLIERD